jgi:hypothetical protein
MILIGSALAVLNYLVLAYLDLFGPTPPTEAEVFAEEGKAPL